MSPKERKERRRQRLAALLRDHFHDNQAKLASKAGIAATLISRYLSGDKGIGESMRDKIEAGTGYIGWFDETDTAPPPHAEPAHQVNEARQETPYVASRALPLLPPAVTIDLDPQCLVIWRQLMDLSERQREDYILRIAYDSANARLQKQGLEPIAPPPSGRPENHSGAPPKKTRDPA